MSKNSKPKKRKSRGEDYVDNLVFSAAIIDYSKTVKESKANGIEPPCVSDYIGNCFMKIARGLARSPNFMNYSYKEDMIMDAVENCIKVVGNFDVDKPTRTGTPNAFSYFTQISYFAFLRRIAKEKKQTTIKQLLIEKGGIGNFAEFDDDDNYSGESVIEKMRQKNDQYFKEENVINPSEELPTKGKGRGRRVAQKKVQDEISLQDFLDTNL